MEIIDVTPEGITVRLGPADALAIGNALNEMCNGIGRDGLDDPDFHARLGSPARRPARCSGRSAPRSTR